MTRQWLFYGLIVILVFLNLFAFVCPVSYQGNEGLFTLIAISITAIVAIFTLNHSISESNRRWDKEINEATLKHCRYFLHDIVDEFVRFQETDLLRDIPVSFNKFMMVDRNDMIRHYPDVVKKYEIASQESRIDAVQLLYKYNAFASSFLIGNLDSQKGKEMIGVVYCAHVDTLTGLIAYYSVDTSTDSLFKYILGLRRSWDLNPRQYINDNSCS